MCIRDRANPIPFPRSTIHVTEALPLLLFTSLMSMLYTWECSNWNLMSIRHRLSEGVRGESRRWKLVSERSKNKKRVRHSLKDNQDSLAKRKGWKKPIEKYRKHADCMSEKLILKHRNQITTERKKVKRDLNSGGRRGSPIFTVTLWATRHGVRAHDRNHSPSLSRPRARARTHTQTHLRALFNGSKPTV